MLEKVTAFVIRKLASGPEVLILEHPTAGCQLPAGTVKPGETAQIAVLREVAEETGLAEAIIEAQIDTEDTLLPEDLAIVLHPTTVFSRPDPTSFDWARLESGTWVKALRRQNGYTQVSFEEPDRLPNPTYTTYQITGWVPDEVLTRRQVRHFFLLRFSGRTPPTWKVNADHHTFTLFWSPLEEIPALIPPQDKWLGYLTEFLAKE
jgi:8-oxo-dGTP pyrophosphatase MutT (NUDIX family)